MSFSLQVDRDSAETLYQQIAGQIRQRIRDGHLSVGARLPGIRPLADGLGVTRLTVQTAYDELRSEGWIETQVGKGTFVARTAQPEALMSSVGHTPTPSGVLDDQPRIDQIAIVRSFAYAEPDPELIPAGEFWHQMNKLRAEAATLMRYNSPQGDPVLRNALTGLLRGRGVEVMPDDVLVTSGITQGISLIVQALTRPGDVVAVERPTHLGLLSMLRAYHLQPVEVGRDAHGPRLEELERTIIQYRPRFFHTVANYHNPTGTSMSERRRRELLDMARQYGLMLTEDDSCGPLAYDRDPQPALKAWDEDDRVVYLSGTAKIIMPGLRLGTLVAPRPLHQQLITLRRAADFCGVPFMQRALATFITGGELQRHLRRVVPTYRERRDRLMQELARHMPEGVKWTHPGGGFTCWLTLPPGVSALDVHREALHQGFAFTPGDAFVVEPGASENLRICFAAQRPQIIAEAMAVLGTIIREAMRQPPWEPDHPGSTPLV